MSNSLKVKSFTLSEMLVVMVITTIVVGLAFTVLNLLTKQIHLISNNYQESVNISKLETALWIDFKTHDKVMAISENRKLIFSNAGIKRSYTFSQEFTLKDRDTLPKVDDFKFFSLRRNVIKGPIDALKLTIGSREVFVFRRNDAAYYLKN